jgi:hypothetical protein
MRSSSKRLEDDVLKLSKHRLHRGADRLTVAVKTDIRHIGVAVFAENNAKIVLERGEQPLDRAGDDRWPTVPDNFRHRDVE